MCGKAVVDNVPCPATTSVVSDTYPIERFESGDIVILRGNLTISAWGTWVERSFVSKVRTMTGDTPCPRRNV